MRVVIRHVKLHLGTNSLYDPAMRLFRSVIVFVCLLALNNQALAAITSNPLCENHGSGAHAQAMADSHAGHMNAMNHSQAASPMSGAEHAGHMDCCDPDGRQSQPASGHHHDGCTCKLGVCQLTQLQVWSVADYRVTPFASLVPALPHATWPLVNRPERLFRPPIV